jgi:hypothetical protein
MSMQVKSDSDWWKGVVLNHLFACGGGIWLCMQVSPHEPLALAVTVSLAVNLAVVVVRYRLRRLRSA